MSFYQNVLQKLLNNHIVSLNDSILIVAGGKKDRNVFYNSGFRNQINEYSVK